MMRPWIALVLVGCAHASRPCPASLPTTELRQIDYPGQTLTFYAAILPGPHDLASVTFAVYLREATDDPLLPPGQRPLGLNFDARAHDHAPARCDALTLYVDGQPVPSHVVGARVVEPTAHDDGIVMTSVRFDRAPDVHDGSCLEIVACGASYPLPAGAGAELARLVRAM